jgi:ABC-type polysaccharide/polyol phosphate export permease
MLGDTGAKVMMLNPLAPIVDGFRLAAIEGTGLMTPVVDANGVGVWSPWLLGYSATWAVGGLLGASLLFHRLEFLFAEYA